MLSMRETAIIGKTNLQNLYRRQRYPLALAPEQECHHGGSALQSGHNSKKSPQIGYT
jgi:hypothetical protein